MSLGDIFRFVLYQFNEISMDAKNRVGITFPSVYYKVKQGFYNLLSALILDFIYNL